MYVARKLASQQEEIAQIVGSLGGEFKWNYDAAGNSSHVHQSLWSLDGEPLFHDPEAEHGMSEMMRQYLAGLLHHASDITYFLAPYINSYKRFVAGTVAPRPASQAATPSEILTAKADTAIRMPRSSGCRPSRTTGSV